MNAVQAMAAVRSHWQAPSATCADAACRASNAPRLVPIPRPIRNTARIKENVYTVPPSTSESKRVQTTSAPSADIPESAIVKYTTQVPDARLALHFVAVWTGTSCQAGEAARARAIEATVRLRATAT